jgi:glyoxylase-like metal-dependent hydrolase (beta-lactamase superfamily II)
MKRFLKIAGLVVLVLVLVIGGVLAVTFMGRRSAVNGQAFGGITVATDGMSAVVVVPLDEGHVALIDAGNDAAGTQILADLSKRKLGKEAVSAILLTHGHPDHIAGIKLFPQAQVMALDAEVPLVEGRAGAKGPVPRLFPVSATGITVARALHDGDVVSLGDKSIRVYAVPGHTAGSAVYFVDGVLAIGDSADVKSDGSLQGSPWIFSDSQAENRAALVRLEKRLTADGVNVTAMVPAHSGAADGVTALTAYARANE